MEKTEMMKEFQAKTGIKAMVMVKNGTLVLPSLTVRASQQFFPSEEYIDWLETKAAAYDRLMSMNSISENDIQIVLDGNAWCAYRLPFRNLQEDNAGFGVTPQMALTALLESELPDGWEEA